MGNTQTGTIQFSEAQILLVQECVLKLATERETQLLQLARRHEEVMEALQEELARVQQELRDEREVRKLAEVELLKAKACQGNTGDAAEQEPGRARSKKLGKSKWLRMITARHRLLVQ
eukprot:jgi/Mesvir1/27361/Mv07171-RA.1